MLENYIFPFWAGFIIVFIPIALYCLFYVFLLFTIGGWENIENAETLKERASSIIIFVIYELIIIIGLCYLISPEFLDSQDLNTKQMISCYCGFVVCIIATRKTFGHKFIDTNLFNKE